MSHIILLKKEAQIKFTLHTDMEPRKRNLVRENPREEKPHHQQWTTVRRRKPRNTPVASKTCFINHLPLTSTIADISKIFRCHGAIANIYIPINQKHQNHKFAFVQFYHPQSLLTAIKDENGREMGTNLITVHPAKFDRPIPSMHSTSHTIYRKPEPKNKQTKIAYRDLRSYREVTKPKTDVVKQNNLKSNLVTQNPDIELLKPTHHSPHFEEFIQPNTNSKPHP